MPLWYLLYWLFIFQKFIGESAIIRVFTKFPKFHKIFRINSQFWIKRSFPIQILICFEVSVLDKGLKKFHCFSYCNCSWFAKHYNDSMLTVKLVLSLDIVLCVLLNLIISFGSHVVNFETLVPFGIDKATELSSLMRLQDGTTK